MVKVSIKPKVILWGKELELVFGKWINIENGRIIGLSDNFLEGAIKHIEPEGLLIPGLINGHTHIGDASFKDVGWELSLEELVAPPDGLKHKLLENTPIEDLNQGIINAINEMILNGITYFSDYREGGIKGVEILNEIMKNKAISCQVLARFKDEIISDWNNINFQGFGLSSLRNTEDTFIQDLIDFCRKKGKIISCHLAERERINERIEKTFKFRPDFVIHGTHLTKEDIKYLTEHDIGIVLCPRSNLMLGAGTPPILDYINEGIKIALGTDNAFVNSMDIFQELNFTTRLIRNIPDGNKIPPKEIFKMATVKAAECLKIDKERGSLDENKIADMVIINLNAPNLYSQTPDYYKLLINRVNATNISKVFKGGICVVSSKYGIIKS